MVNKIKRWYGSWLAGIIEKAARSIEYDRYQYLCVVLYKKRPFGTRLAIRHILSRVGDTQTLCTRLDRAGGANRLSYRWPERIQYHRRYWELMCAALRKGDFQWGRTIDLDELGVPPAKEVA